jgi:hypothetical protein
MSYVVYDGGQASFFTSLSSIMLPNITSTFRVSVVKDGHRALFF